MQDDNNNLRKELNEKQQSQAKQQTANGNSSRAGDFYGLEMIQSQNDALKHDIEIMKIKLKQFEHMQQLTLMLQESHKLVDVRRLAKKVAQIKNNLFDLI